MFIRMQLYSLCMLLNKVDHVFWSYIAIGDKNLLSRDQTFDMTESVVIVIVQ